MIYVFIRLSLSRQKYDMSHSKNKYIKKCWCSSYRSSKFLVNFREIRNFMALNAHHYIISTKFSQNIRLKMPSCQSEQVKKVFTIDLMCTSLTFHEVEWFWPYLSISCISFFVNFCLFYFLPIFHIKNNILWFPRWKYFSLYIICLLIFFIMFLDI